eukprot:gene7284-8061_t
MNTLFLRLLALLACLAIVTSWATTFQSTTHNKYNRLPFAHAVSGSSFHLGATTKQSNGIEQVDALVVGSGISGSTAAFYLQKQGHKVALAESREVVGGNLITKKAEGYLWEEGPNSFQPNAAILRLAKDLGMIDELVLADPTLPRFVYWENHLHALPAGVTDLLNFNLLSWPGKIRAGLGALGLIAPPPGDEESVEDWVTRHLGKETFERIIDPFVSGVYAGDPKRLSMSQALKKVFRLESLGVTRGVLDGAIVRMKQMAAERKATAERDADLPKVAGGSLGSFRDGLLSVPQRIAQQLDSDQLLLGHRLKEVQRDNKDWISTFETPQGLRKVRSKALLLTSPSYATADVVAQSAPEVFGVAGLQEKLREIYYPPVASVSIAYPNSAFKKELVGFGHLLPRRAGLRTLGTIWVSSLFPGRAPEGHTMLLNYIGGARDPAIAKLSPEEIVSIVHGDVQQVLLRPGAPAPKVLGVRLWQKAIPQYEKGHAGRIEAVQQAMANRPGLFLGGNYVTGVAFGDCIQYGADVAQEVSSYLSKK